MDDETNWQAFMELVKAQETVLATIRAGRAAGVSSEVLEEARLNFYKLEWKKIRLALNATKP